MNLFPLPIVYFRAYKVVRPDWIIDSKKAGKQLNWKDYRLIKNLSNQKELTFRAKKEYEDNNSTGTMSLTKVNDSTSISIPCNNSNNNDNNNNANNNNNLNQNIPPHIKNKNYNSTNPNDKKNTEYINIAQQSTHPHNSGNKPTTLLIKEQQKIENSSINKDSSSIMNNWERNHTSTHPGFIKNYYKSSRLHYLSAMREELKNIVRKAEQHHQQQQCKLKSSYDDCSNDSKEGLQYYIMHVDFDCFFTSVGIKDRPELKDQPVAVAHGNGLKDNSSSDIASCNYKAREFGVYNGMIVGKAKKLCPNLKIIPYEFDKYKEVSEAFYNVLFQFTKDIQAVSVDEALLEIWASNSQGDDSEIESLVTTLRNNIRQNTGCEASVGIGPNILLAKLATKKAKPCGQYYCKPQEVDEFLSDQKIINLPGVGHAMASKFKDLLVETIGDLKKLTLKSLTSKFGLRTGQVFFNYARGIDDSKLIKNQPRKSISAEITWAIRFENKEQVYEFLTSLSNEVSERLKNINKKGKSITLKVMVRSPNAPKEAKYLGHGHCDSRSKSTLLDRYTDDPDTIALYIKNLFDSLNLSITKIRGLGIHIHKLNNEDEVVVAKNKNSMKYFQPIEATSDKNKEKVVNNTPPKETIIVDYNVFMELPSNIREELKRKHELQLINKLAEDIPSTSYAHQSLKSNTHHQMKDILMNEVDIDNDDGVNDIEIESDYLFVENSSPKSVSQSIPDLPNWSQLDPEALLALPESMQRQILEAYKKLNKSKQEKHRNSIKPTASLHSTATTTVPIRNDGSKIAKPQHNRIKGKQKEKINSNNNSNTCTLTQIYATSNKNEFKDCIINLSKKNINPNHNENRRYMSNNLDVGHPIDMAIWSELPQDIQQELLDDYNKHHEDSINIREPIPKNTKKIKCPKLMGKSELSEVRELITTWVENYIEIPHENDVTTIKTYLLDLVKHKELENVQLLLLHLINISKIKCSTKWKPFIEDIQNSVSNAIKDAYNATLSLK
ncbi:unnamed protein product [Cunninghamella blakesleeana]